MRNRQPQDGHAPQQNGSMELLSPGTVPDLVEQLQQRHRENAERAARSAALMVEAGKHEERAADLRDQLVEVEQRFNRLRAEFEQEAQAARDKRNEAGDWANAQLDAKHRAADLENILRIIAPDVLETLAQATPPQGQPPVETTPDAQPAPGDRQVAQAPAGGSPLETAVIPVQPKSGQRP